MNGVFAKTWLSERKHSTHHDLVYHTWVPSSREEKQKHVLLIFDFMTLLGVRGVVEMIVFVESEYEAISSHMHPFQIKFDEFHKMSWSLTRTKYWSCMDLIQIPGKFRGRAWPVGSAGHGRRCGRNGGVWVLGGAATYESTECQMTGVPAYVQ